MELCNRSKRANQKMIALKKYQALLLLMAVTISVYPQPASNKIIVPLGGNSWVTVKAKNGKEKVTDNGWQNWQHADAVWSTYIKVQKTGTLKIAALLNVPAGKSKLQWTINGISETIIVSGIASKEYEIGEWNIIQPGYIKIDTRGTSKTGGIFANVSELNIAGTATNEQTAFVKSNEGNYFYWGRRGPSVHINYDLSETGDDIEWFYSEITVPVGNDPIGSYFMADGFGEGYFGMQVNSPTERRILFSVWSPFITDNPKEIPDDKKIVLLRKGKDVHSGEFGNEGSGGQSYLKYNWKAGVTYKFLLQAKPGENNYTAYTAYFYADEQKKWLLIASFNRPATSTYLKRLHSFLENFEPETGLIPRKAWYHNQWVRTKTGEWKAITKMQFTGDATANKGYRLDYSGGEENGKFYLRNCGFFNDNTVLKTKFSVSSTGKMPVIDFSDLE
jgi:hypothetical protein